MTICKLIPIVLVIFASIINQSPALITISTTGSTVAKVVAWHGYGRAAAIVASSATRLKLRKGTTDGDPQVNLNGGTSINRTLIDKILMEQEQLLKQYQENEKVYELKLQATKVNWKMVLKEKEDEMDSVLKEKVRGMNLALKEKVKNMEKARKEKEKDMEKARKEKVKDMEKALKEKVKDMEKALKEKEKDMDKVVIEKDKVLRKLEKYSESVLKKKSITIHNMEKEVLMAEGELTCRGILQWAAIKVAIENGSRDWRCTSVLYNLTKIYDTNQTRKNCPVTNLLICSWENHVSEERKEKETIGQFYTRLYNVLSHEIHGVPWSGPSVKNTFNESQEVYKNFISDICDYLGLELSD